MNTYSILIVGCIVGFLFIYYLGLRQRHIHIWIVNYILGLLKPRVHFNGPTHILFSFVDHYEPLYGGVNEEKGNNRVDKWLKQYPEIAEKYKDADGKPPVHSYFFPEEEYRPDFLNKLHQLCKLGYGEVEIHLHHDNDTEDGFKNKIRGFLQILKQHKLVSMLDGKPCFAFIHGNWALDNARPDGRWCGINNEISLLRDLGCYADYTLPSAPSDTQTKLINQIYYATDDPIKPKSHDSGVPVKMGGMQSGDLMIIQGPLTLNWRRRKLLFWPAVENSDVTPTALPFEERIDLWIKQGIHVSGRPEWIFVKVHTHGAEELNADYLFDDGAFQKLFSHLENTYNNGRDYVLHYVSARETYNIIKAAEAGLTGDPNQFRDFKIPRPKY